MDKFTNKVLKYRRENKLIDKNDLITVGFSGGADSVSLLLLLYELKALLKIELLAVHIHHGIRGAEADRDETFCRQLAAEHNISYRAVYVDAPLYARQHGLTVEEAGRILRYEKMREEAAGLSDGEANVRTLIAVAHHADDQAETILFNMLRGSGLRGLSGIRPKRDDIIRPLLCVTKKEILDWLRIKKAEYVTDSTNLENDHTRNYIRNAVMPALRDNINTEASEHIAFLGGQAFEASEFISSEASEYLGKVQKKPFKLTDGYIAVKLGQTVLKEKAQIFRIYVIIEALKMLDIPLKDWGSRHFYDIDRMLFMGKGAHTDLPGAVYAENEHRETLIIKRLS